MPVWVSFVLLGIGILAIYVEIFVPAAGLIGLAGGGMIVAGVVLGYAHHDPVTGTVVLFASLVLTPTAIALGLKAFPRTRFGKRLILGPPPGSADADDRIPDAVRSGTGPNDAIGRDPAGVRTGDDGEAVTVLRPSGTARIGARKMSVVTSGEYIERGARVRVVRVEGSRIVVREDPS